MILEIKKKFGHYLLKRRIAKKIPESISFNRIISDSKSVMIIIPVKDEDFFPSLEIVRYFFIHKKEVTLFLPEFRYNQIPEKDKYQFISFLPVQITKCFLPNKKLIQRLQAKQVDIVIDLNRNEDIFFSAVANTVISKVRIGFKKEKSDSYYNLLFECKQTDANAAFFNLLNYLRMF